MKGKIMMVLPAVILVLTVLLGAYRTMQHQQHDAAGKPGEHQPASR